MTDGEEILEKILKRVEEDHNLILQTQEKLISIEGWIEGETKRINRLVNRVSTLEEKQRVPSKLELIMDKTSATGIGIIVMIIGIFGAVIAGLFVGGVEVATQMWDMIGWFLPILAVYFGISSTSNVKQMFERVLKELTKNRIKEDRKDDEG